MPKRSISPQSAFAPAEPLTISRFALASGFSKTTVSKAFSGNGRIAPATRDAVLKAAREMGFAINPHAQRLGRGGVISDLVGLFCPGRTAGTGATKCLLIQEKLDALGLDVPFYSSGVKDGSQGEAQAAALRRLRRLRPRALVCATFTIHPAAIEELRLYQAGGGIVVCFDAPINLPHADQVLFDRQHSSDCAVRHLLQQGHRKVGLYLVGRRDAPDRNPHLPPRYEGFASALRDYDLTPNPDWIRDGMDSEADGARLGQWFINLPLPRPTGLCIVNENVASAFINEVQRAGLRVPYDVSVVSHDDLPIAAHAAVPLTTVSQPVEQIAQSVCEVLMDRLANPSLPPRVLTVRGHLVERQSTAPLPSFVYGAA